MFGNYCEVVSESKWITIIVHDEINIDPCNKR